MRGGRAALQLSLCAGLLVWPWSRPAFAPGIAHPQGQALLFLVDRVSFEELMAVPEFRQLARSGGAALMTTHVGTGNRESSSYLTIGAGTVTDAGSGSRCSGL